MGWSLQGRGLPESARAEMEAVDQALGAQAEALKELRLVSEDLYQAALKPDPLLFPFSQQGPCQIGRAHV